MSNDKNKNLWWQLGLKIFVESTGWIAIPIIGALFLGRWLDVKYATQPLFFLSLTFLALIISSIGIARIGVKYIRLLEGGKDNSKNNKKDYLHKKDDL